MRTRYLASLIAIFLLAAVASAQGYSIRANRGLNLRAAPSLNADIAGTVRSGAILQVAGHVGKWLKIAQAGKEVWLADWVNYSRVDETPAQTESSSPVNNCCFVDRQCSSDQEWINGYWAYQNNHCPAPSASQSGSARPPAGAETSAINNCCFAGWQCNNDQDWINGYHAHQNNQCGAATAARNADSCCQQGIIIEGSQTFVARVSAALDLLRLRAPRWHAYVTKGPLKIAESHAGAPDGYAYANSIYISPAAAAKPAYVLAELLVHEACHVQRTLAGFFRYETEQEQNLEEFLCSYVGTVMREKLIYGRVITTYSSTQVARLIRDGVLEQRVSPGRLSVTYVPSEVYELLRAGIDFFGALRAEIARANRLLR